MKASDIYNILVESQNVKIQYIEKGDLPYDLDQLQVISSSEQAKVYDKGDSVIKIVKMQGQHDNHPFFRYIQLSLKRSGNPFFPRIMALFTYDDVLVCHMEKLYGLNTVNIDEEYMMNQLGISRELLDSSFTGPDSTSEFAKLTHLLRTKPEFLKKIREKSNNPKFVKAISSIKTAGLGNVLDLGQDSWLFRPTTNGPHLVLSNLM